MIQYKEGDRVRVVARSRIYHAITIGSIAKITCVDGYRVTLLGWTTDNDKSSQISQCLHVQDVTPYISLNKGNKPYTLLQKEYR